ncbi:MAG TPA: glycosyltransferase family 4 protein [Steroidobacteraceae bacterium]|jgi:glycosyltransferase involved in cell wall biosynthesis
MPKQSVTSRRVLVVTPQPFYQDRGTPIALAHVCRALGQLGFEVDLLAFPIGQESLIPATTIHRCANPLGIRAVPIGFSVGKALLDLTLARSFWHMLRTRNYGVVHAVEEAAYLAALLCPRLGTPFIYDMASAIPVELRRHKVLGTALAQRALGDFERLVLRRASQIVCSTGLADYVRAAVPGISLTEWRFPPLIDVADQAAVRQLRGELDIPADAHVVAYTGNFAAYQRLDLLFGAFTQALTVDPKLMLVCVGASTKARAGALAQFAPHARGRVRILAPESRDRMPAYLAMADCLISLRPSSDNLPLKVLDYMVAGRPIVATRGRAHEPVLNGERAFLCEARTESVQKAILEVFGSPERARAVASAARSHALQFYGWDRFVQLIEGLYGNVSALRPRQRLPNSSAGPATRAASCSSTLPHQ